MALARDLQSQHGYFRLNALAPVSGPYDLPGAEVPGLFNGQLDPAIAPYYCLPPGSSACSATRTARS